MPLSGKPNKLTMHNIGYPPAGIFILTMKSRKFEDRLQEEDFEVRVLPSGSFGRWQ